MNFDISVLLADLAHAPEKSCHDLSVAVRGWVGNTVERDRVPVAFKGDPAEPCDQWLSAGALDLGFEACSQSVRCLDFGRVAGFHLRHRRAMFRRQSPQHRCAHGPFDPGHPVAGPRRCNLSSGLTVSGLDAEDGEDVVVVVEIASGVSGVGASGKADGVDRQVPEAGEGSWCGTGPDL